MFARTLILPVLLTVCVRLHPAQVVHYELLYGSTISQKVGNSVTGFWAAKGGFNLRLAEQTAINLQYTIEDLQITGGLQVQLAGVGALQFPAGGPQQISLTLTNLTGGAVVPIQFTNVIITPDRKWPMLALRARQASDGDAVYTIDIRAAPFHDIWISPALDFRANALSSPTNVIHSGDLISIDGRVIKRNADLLAPFGPTIASDYGLDAISFSPHSGLSISAHDVGSIRDGDILLQNPPSRLTYTDIFTNAAATGMTDPGIDGIQFTSQSEFYFSVKRDSDYAIPSGARVRIRDSDIWWTDLQTHELRLARSREELFSFSEYRPWLTDEQVGIDAFYIWPSGEVWFSLRSSWTAHTAIYSSDGYGVFTDTFAFQAFKPAMDPGLDAFLVITDLKQFATVQSTLTTHLSPAGVATFEWMPTAGAYQVEAADSVSAPFRAASPVIATESFTDIRPAAAPARFYRVRQW
jgi:hypothetical protein